MVGAALGFGVFQTAAGLMASLVLTAAMLAPTGLCALLLTTAMNTNVQLSVHPALHERVMGPYVKLFLGSTPIGSPLLGLVGRHLGGREPTIAGASSVLAVLVLLLPLRRALRRRTEAAADAGRGPRTRSGDRSGAGGEKGSPKVRVGQFRIRRFVVGASVPERIETPPGSCDPCSKRPHNR